MYLLNYHILIFNDKFLLAYVYKFIRDFKIKRLLEIIKTIIKPRIIMVSIPHRYHHVKKKNGAIQFSKIIEILEGTH